MFILPLFTRFLYIPGGAGFLPSTVSIINIILLQDSLAVA